MPSKFRSVHSLYTIFPSWRTKKSRIFASLANRKFHLVQTYVGKFWSFAERFWRHHVLQFPNITVRQGTVPSTSPVWWFLYHEKYHSPHPAPQKQKRHEVEWSCAFAEYSHKKCQRRDSNPQRHKDIRFWGGHVCQFRHAGKKSVKWKTRTHKWRIYLPFQFDF